jgi:hypothetical protein
MRVMYAQVRALAYRQGFEGDFNALCREVIRELGADPTPLVWVQIAMAVVDCQGVTTTTSDAQPTRARVVSFIGDRDIFSQEMMDDDLYWHLSEGA